MVFVDLHGAYSDNSPVVENSFFWRITLALNKFMVYNYKLKSYPDLESIKYNGIYPNRADFYQANIIRIYNTHNLYSECIENYFDLLKTFPLSIFAIELSAQALKNSFVHIDKKKKQSYLTILKLNFLRLKNYVIVMNIRMSMGLKNNCSQCYIIHYLSWKNYYRRK